MNTSLYRSYVKVALRNSRKNLATIAINVIGMGLSLSFCITVYMLHAYNLEFDFFHKEAKDMHRLHSLRWTNEELGRFELAPLPFVSKIEEEIPGVEGLTYYETHNGTLKVANTNFRTSKDYFPQYIASVRSNFFEYFDFPLQSGSEAGITDGFGVYLTEETAKKLFGDVSPVGETVTLFLGEEKGVDLQVAGVFEKIPLNNSFNFNILVNHSTILNATGSSEASWEHSDNVSIYLKTKTPDQVASALQGFLPEQHINQENWKIASLELLEFHDKRLTEDFMAYAPANLRIGVSAMLVFTILAILILLVACFNLANTAMALMSKRIREIGIRKTLGTSNFQLFEQFMMEMLVISVFAFVIAVAFANPISSQIFGLFGASFLLQDISIFRFVPFVLVFLLVCTFLAGVLPALYAWKFTPVSILSGKQSLKGVGWFQRLLTIGQYAVSICLLVCAWTFSQNGHYLSEIDLGHNYDQVVMLPLDSNEDYEMVRNDIDQLASTVQVIGTSNHHGASRGRGSLKTDTTDIEVSTYSVSANYLNVMEIELKTGRSFIEGSALDKTTAVIINEEFSSRHLDIRQDPIGQQVEIDGEKRTVIGVAANIIEHVYTDFRPRPVAYYLGDATTYQMLIAKTAASNTDALEDQIKGYWSENFDTPYRGRSQKMVSSFYATRDARNLKLIFLSIAILGSLLSTIGIFSMAVMNVAKRTKEISIRRVLGARIHQVLVLIYKSFGWIIGISMALGIAGGILLSEVVLAQIYKFYQDARILDSTLIGIVIMTLALFFISMAALNRVIANPSVGLRTE